MLGFGWQELLIILIMVMIIFGAGTPIEGGFAVPWITRRNESQATRMLPR